MHYFLIICSWILGNKIDREDREIPTHVGEDFAQRHGMYFLETSAKEAENVERLFMEIAAELMEVSKHVSYKTLHCLEDFSVIPYYFSKHVVRNYLDMKRIQLQ